MNSALEAGISLTETLAFHKRRLNASLKASCLSHQTKSLVEQCSREYFNNALKHIDHPEECFKDFATDVFVLVLSLSGLNKSITEDVTRYFQPMTSIDSLIKALEALEHKSKENNA